MPSYPLEPPWLAERACCSQASGAAGLQFIASVKANGYGHGAAAVTEQLVAAGVDTIWTGSYAEAVATKRAVGAEDVKVLMFAGGVPAGMEALLAEGLVPTLYDMAGATACSAAADPDRGWTEQSPTDVCVKVPLPVIS